jgi:hypothetical protein
MACVLLNVAAMPKSLVVRVLNVEVCDDPETVRVFPGCPISVGSDPESVLCLPDPRVHPHQGMFFTTGEGVQYMDLAAGADGFAVTFGLTSTAPIQIGPYRIFAHLEERAALDLVLSAEATSIASGLASIAGPPRSAATCTAALLVDDLDSFFEMGARAAGVVDLLSEVIAELHCKLARIRSAVAAVPPAPAEPDLGDALRLAQAEARLREVRSHIADLVRRESHLATYALRPFFSSPFGKA